MGKFLDALKNLGNKLNGTTPSSTTTVAVINEIAEDYVAPQEALTFDTVPTTNSTNPVTSGGIKTYVDGLMSGALKRAIVETLPTEDIDPNTIYMVLDAEAASGNVYNEYLYINEAWELIGTTEVAETVIANPTLVGTETALTGLQVGDTKYAVGGTSHLYEHHIWILSTFTDNKYVCCGVITTSSTPFTALTFLQWLYDQNYREPSKALIANGTDNILGVYSENGAGLLETKGASYTNLGSVANLSLTDTVRTIL